MFLGQHLLAHKSNLAIICNTNPTWPLYWKTNVTLVINIWQVLLRYIGTYNLLTIKVVLHPYTCLTYYNILNGKPEI